MSISLSVLISATTAYSRGNVDSGYVDDTTQYNDGITSGRCGANAFYTLNHDTGVLTISGTGPTGLSSDTYKSHFDSNTEIKKVVIEEGITVLCDSTFYGCSGIESVTFPDSLFSIGGSAFYGCTSLSEITLPENLYFLGSSAFSGCTALNSISLPDNIVYFMMDAFENTGYYNNSSNWDKGILYIGNYLVSSSSEHFVQSSSLNVREGTVQICCDAFYGNTKISSVTLPDGIKIIGTSAFENSIVSEINLPDSITHVGRSVFDGTSIYKDFQSGSSKVLYVGNHLIKAKGSLNGSYTVKSGTKTIAAWAFESCCNLTDITLPESLVCIGGRAFAYTNLYDVVIPDGVKYVQRGIFGDCSALKTVNFPKSVEIIEDIDDCFSGCDSLEFVHIGNPDAIIDPLADLLGYNKSRYTGDIRDAVIVGYDCSTAEEFCNKYSVEFVSISSMTTACSAGETHVIERKITKPTCVNSGKTVYRCVNCGNDVYFVIDSTGIHTYDDGVVTVPPTCIAKGTKTFTCTGCSSYYTEEIAETGIHQYDGGVVIDKPTCTQEGTTKFSCIYCDNYYYEFPDALGHIYVQSAHSDETCTENGYTTYTCTRCNNSYTDIIPSKGGHAYDDGVVTTAPTCVSAGEKKYTCSVCGDSYTVTIEATGIHTYDDGVITKAPSCVDGTKVYTCGVCGYSYTETIPATNEHNYDNGVVTKAPTCIAGIKTYTCSDCGGSYTEEIPKAYEHSYNGVVTKEPTCVAKGEKTFTCSVCGDSYTEPINATGVHTYDEGVVTKAPTCVAQGTKTFTCSVCGNSYTEPIAATGEHIYGEGIITVAPTCVDSGTITYRCLNCTDSYTEEYPALGHNYKLTYSAEPTCTEDGIEVYTCSGCGDSFSKFFPALDHNFKATLKKATTKADGEWVCSCTRCGEIDWDTTIFQIKEVSLSCTSYQYNGKAKTPKVYVYDREGYRIPSDYYTVKYPGGRKKLGTYTVTITFKGDYSGKVTRKFQILPRMVNEKTLKSKPASTKAISVSWKKVKDVDGYEIYRWNNKKNDYVFYKRTTKTSIKINRDSEQRNDVLYYIRTYKKVGKKTYKSIALVDFNWVKLSAPTFKTRQDDFREFDIIFPYKGFYDVQISNNKQFSNADNDRTKKRWTDTYQRNCKKIHFSNASANKPYYIRARKYYYNKKNKLVVGPWSKVKVVKPY